MSEEFDHIDLFDSYLDGGMNDEETKNFEERLSNDDALADEFELYKRSIHIINREGIRQEMKEITDRGGKGNTMLYWSAGIAASIVLALFVFNPFSSGDGPDLYEEYYAPYPNIITSRSDDPLLQGLEDYEDGKYEAAIQALNSQGLSNDTIRFYLAMSYMGAQKHAEAVELLKLSTPSSKFSQQERWYLGLAYIALDQRQEAIRLLSDIGPSEFKYEEAQKILSESD